MKNVAPDPIELHPAQRSPEVADFDRKLHRKFIGQEEAVSQLVDVYQMVQARMSSPGRPVANLLFLGPTGSGKTRLVEAAAEILFGSANALIKVDCAEFQHGHEIAKLVGSPPGYLGHRETPPTLTQEALDRFHTDRLKLSFILFDEIEKANDSLWQLLLGILDKATLTLGDNRRVDLSRCIVFMTSNLGAAEMTKLADDGIGFAPKPTITQRIEATDRSMHRVAIEAAKRRFSPEFMNRIDKVVVFRTLTPAQLRQVLDIELDLVRNRILATQPERYFAFECTDAAKALLLQEGTDAHYGARHLKRAIERHVVFPISALIATAQVNACDVIRIDVSPAGDRLIFLKESTPMEACPVDAPDGPSGGPPAAGATPARSAFWSKAAARRG